MTNNGRQYPFRLLGLTNETLCPSIKQSLRIRRKSSEWMKWYTETKVVMENTLRIYDRDFSRAKQYVDNEDKKKRMKPD